MNPLATQEHTVKQAASYKEVTMSSFKQTLENRQNNREFTPEKNDLQIERETTQQLLDDIFSVMQTGLTKAEHEALNELIQKIKQSMKKEDVNEEEIQSLFKQLEEMMISFQKRLGGEIIQNEEKSSIKNDMPLSIEQMTSRIEELSKANEELKTYNRLVKQHNELEYLEVLKKAI
jgi:hypothetical protein